MTIELLKHPTAEDWVLCKKATLVTVGKKAVNEPDMVWKKAILEARHSPIRLLHFVYLLTDVPYWVSVHLCRHHVGIQPFVRSQRNDRQEMYDRNSARQDAPVSLIVDVNAEALMVLANKRLCLQAADETRQLVRAMCDAAAETNPEIAPFLVPMCKYHGGLCHEMFPCPGGEKK